MFDNLFSKFKHTYSYGDSRHLFQCVDRNKEDEYIVVEVTKCELNYDRKWATGYLWKQAGRIDGTLTCYWHVNTCVYSRHGAYGAYNPFEIELRGKPERHPFNRDEWVTPSRHVIDFAWLMEATDENLNAILEEVYRRFMMMEPIHLSPDSYVA